MDIELGVKAQVAARRSAHPWLEGDHLALGPGPQLFTDWRYVLPGEVGAMGPYWAGPDGTPIPLRLWDDVDRRDQPIRARFVPSDVAQRYPHRRGNGAAGRAVASGCAPWAQNHVPRRAVPDLV